MLRRVGRVGGVARRARRPRPPEAEKAADGLEHRGLRGVRAPPSPQGLDAYPELQGEDDDQHAKDHRQRERRDDRVYCEHRHREDESCQEAEAPHRAREQSKGVHANEDEQLEQRLAHGALVDAGRRPCNVHDREEVEQDVVHDVGADEEYAALAPP
uniref:Uncharacterized protein n=1 Tax=Tetraselmis sp. GSL018 TaxID=582737 RepID=A0A061QTQ1_9CHLO